MVRQYAHLQFAALPVTAPRQPQFSAPASAAAAFDAPQFISGTVKLRARSMKDEESTQNCTQAFVVVACQPRSLEVVIAAQRYLLCPGDHFFVPQGTKYNLTNYSPDTDAEVAFIVIKPSDADAPPLASPAAGEASALLAGAADASAASASGGGAADASAAAVSPAAAAAAAAAAGEG